MTTPKEDDIPTPRIDSVLGPDPDETPRCNVFDRNNYAQAYAPLLAFARMLERELAAAFGRLAEAQTERREALLDLLTGFPILSVANNDDLRMVVRAAVEYDTELRGSLAEACRTADYWKTALNAAKTPAGCVKDGGWIPMGGRKPPTEGWYLVHRASFPKEMQTAYWRRGAWFLFPWRDEPTGQEGALRITAWHHAPALPGANRDSRRKS